MPASGGHDSDRDTFSTPHAQSEASSQHHGHPRQQAFHDPHAALSAGAQSSQPGAQSASSNGHLGARASGSQRRLQPHRLPPEPPTNARLEPAYTSSAPVGVSPSAPPCTPERPYPSTADKSGSPQTAQQQQPQLYRRSPSTLLSRASARIKVALEASDTGAKGGPADPPPRQPGLPPSSGHRRTYSHQVWEHAEMRHSFLLAVCIIPRSLACQ